MSDHHGIHLNVPPDVYPPAEDSYLLANNIAPNGRVLEIGTGSGVVAITLAKKGFDVVATDINPNALRAVLANARANGVEGRVDVVRADLLRGIRGPFDTVVFNPPYLPSRPLGELRGIGELGLPGILDGLAAGPAYGRPGEEAPNSIPEENVDGDDDGERDEPDDWLSRSWRGGKDGSEVIDRFMGQLGRCLATGGKGYMVVSSLTDLRIPKGSGLDFRVVAEQAQPFEKLLIIELFKRADGR